MSPPIEEGTMNKVMNAKYSKLEYFLLVVIILLSSLLLLMNYAAQKDTYSLKLTLHECYQKIAYINDGKMPMMNFNISGVENVTKNPTK